MAARKKMVRSLIESDIRIAMMSLPDAKKSTR